MLNKYETIYIINSNVEQDGIKSLVEKFKTLIETEGGKVSEVQEWGMKRLAYPIKKLEQGYYVLVNFESEPKLIEELERVYRITDEVIKFITIRKED
jgi:small subunit ribosomal protein S6